MTFILIKSVCHILIIVNKNYMIRKKVLLTASVLRCLITLIVQNSEHNMRFLLLQYLYLQ